VDSIVSSNGQEDHVSMGANAATKMLRVCNNLHSILAIEYMNAAQALEFRKPLKSSDMIEEMLAKYRKVVSKLENDRFLHTDIMNTIEFMEQNQVPTA
jgi:histidine ammonia-lyase